MPDHSPAERRTSVRQREFSAGIIAKPGDPVVVNCLIRDLGDKGAQIRVNRNTAIQPGSYLINLRRGCASELRPVWQQSSLTGVTLSDVCDLEPSHLGFLRSLFGYAELRKFVPTAAFTGHGTPANDH
jgi:hypothetical protein